MKTQRFTPFLGKTVFSLIVLTICLGFTVMSHGSAVVSVQPATLEVPKVGEPFTLHVDITGGEVSIAGYQFSVAFDASALRYVAATNADYLPSESFAMPLPEADSVTLVAVTLKDAPLAVGDGTLATLTFEVLESKPFGVHLTDVILSDPTPKALAVRWSDTRLDGALETLPAEQTSLFGNYPNPFNPETWIPYQLSEEADVTLTIYGTNGQLVRTLALGHQAAGIYHRKGRAAYWDGRNDFGERVASGLYFYTLTAGEFAATGKMLIMK
ncbi:hypothetical protein C6500_10465 [Candidatus Poribacteria bacterium]|nr:MAG: hypothetical protein C6500_10465 [Candidatus Poribacteria bacterium]